MKDISVEKNKFVALWVETTFWGIYTALFCICVYVLLYLKKASRRVNKLLLSAAIIMYLLCTAHVINDFVRAMVGFIDYTNRGGAKAYFQQIWVWSYLFRHSLYVTNIMVADALLVYRLYIVWSRDKRVVLGPLLLLIGTAVCGYRTVWGYSQAKPGDTNHAIVIYHWAVLVFSLSLCTNVIVTCLIAWRIWWVGRAIAQTLDREHGRKYSQALAIIIESGAISSIATLIVLVAFVSGTKAVDIARDPLIQITGIAPTLIIVRVGLGLSEDGTSYYSTAFRTTDVRGTIPFNFRTQASGMTEDSRASLENAAGTPKEHEGTANAV
ncbi:hypothetical protein WG66_013368 [Moniliophthora roreri]|nr:hypothetical protein WG66_013368 [Moniliophthora roreri]